MLVEILFLAQQFQCGAGAELATFAVTVNEQRIEVGEVAYVQVDDLNDIYINDIDQITGGNCTLPLEDSTFMWLDYENEVPNVGGYDNQLSLQDLLDEEVGLDTQYHLVVSEVGTTNMESSAADFQDVVLKLDTNQGRVHQKMLQNVYAD